MLNLAEYRRRASLLADHLPWAALVAPGVVLNKDGSLQRSFRFRGPDLESATESELVAACARLNNVLRRLGSGWALFFEAERFAAPAYPDSDFPDPVSRLVDEERRASFEAEGVAYESAYHLTLTWMPPPDPVQRAEQALIEAGGEPSAHLAWFGTETDRILDLLGGVLPEVAALDDAGTLAYLHGTISTRAHGIDVPEVPVHLDAVLVDTPVSGGLEPCLGDEHLAILTLRGLPNTTRPGLLDELNHLGFGYRWVTRFIPLDRVAATRVLGRLRRQWFAKRKSMAALLREVMFNEPVPLLDSDADNKAADADAALQELGEGQVAFGYLTTTVCVRDPSRAIANDRLRAVERVVNAHGFATILESVNALEAWLGSLPGHVYANIRQPLVHTLNLAHFVPLSAVWAGPARNEHLQGPPLLIAAARGTPFRLSTHVGDVGHMMVVGPTGAGKSVLLALIALQFRRYPGAQVFIFDKGFSARAAVLGMGGGHLELGAANAFQPLADIDAADVRSWAVDWILGLFEHERVEIKPELKEAVWSALTSLAAAPRAERTLTGLSVLLQSNALKAALAPYTLDGPHGRLLDAAEDTLSLADVQCFEMEELLARPAVLGPVLGYLFHRLEQRFDGRPTLLILDEAWAYLDDARFAARLRDWLKTLRKKNVAVVFATQSLADIAGSAIAPALIESCPQRIFLSNDRALEPQQREAYARFGLNERQVALIASAVPKREYYLQSRVGCRLFELALGPVALAFCATSSSEDQKAIDSIDPPFAPNWLRARGLAWAADLLDEEVGDAQ